MTAKDYLEYIVEQIHSTVVATVDEDGLPVTCVIDMMYDDENGLYFLTARGKSFYKRLKDKGFIALSGKNGELICWIFSLRRIRICLRYTRLKTAERLLRYFNSMRAAENGLTSPKSPLSVTVFLSAVRRTKQADIS